MKQIKDQIKKAAQNLEDAFFLQEDNKLLERLKKLRLMEETKENLSKVSGIKNDALLIKLVELDIKPEIIACLALFPLIEAAWADGEIDPKERAFVERAAKENGFGNDENQMIIINQWLTHKPETRLLKAWKVYIHGLCERLTEPERLQLKTELLGRARAVAEATGGFLGLMSISHQEQEVLDDLASCFTL